jgi:Ca2+-transporting ATPase
MEQKSWHRLGAEELQEMFSVHPGAGLSAEAAAERRKESGYNELSEGKKVSPVTLMLNQFKDFMVLVLMGATLVSGLLGEYLDAITIIAIILLNGVLGFRAGVPGGAFAAGTEAAVGAYCQSHCATAKQPYHCCQNAGPR